MIRSMTAFARTQLDEAWGSAQWELRSVNNRYLDVATRLPEDFRSLEPGVRERVAARLGRGKVDCTLRAGPSTEREGALVYDEMLAARLIEAAGRIRAGMPEAAPASPFEVLRWPGVLRAEAPDLEAASARLLTALDTALDELVANRAREGERIAAMIEARCREIEAIVAGVRARQGEVVAALRERLRSRVAELGVEPVSERLEQEVALLAQKADVAEEIDRLDSHLAEVRRAIGSDRPVGRRLDFLMQELNREANTLGSKAADVETTRASVDLKVLIEQMREQIQNVE